MITKRKACRSSQRASSLRGGIAALALSSVVVAPAAAEANERLGLLFTSDELAAWQARAVSGPYKTQGDVSENSPNDWDFLTQQAEDFLAEPSAGRWPGPADDGCVGFETDVGESFDNTLYAAAFVSRVTGDAAMRQAVRDELVAQATMPVWDFNDAGLWCAETLDDDAPPMFSTTAWLHKRLSAYQFIRDDLAEADRVLLDAWFHDGAVFFTEVVDDSLDRLFVDRRGGNYELSSYGEAMNGSLGRLTHFGGHQTSGLSRWYNNRRAATYTYAALAAVLAGDDDLKLAASRFVKEWIRFSMYSDGMLGEYERWSAGLPDLGWGYAGTMTGNMVLIADVFARAGDSELYDYTTEEGALGTESPGTPKSIHLALTRQGAFLDGSLDYYGTDDPAKVGDPDYRIDGWDDDYYANGWDGVHDLAALAPANMYYVDEGLRGIVMRETTTRGYPASPASHGAYRAWQGFWGSHPGVLFMYGQLDGVIDPYPPFDGDGGGGGGGGGEGGEGGAAATSGSGGDDEGAGGQGDDGGPTGGGGDDAGPDDDDGDGDASATSVTTGGDGGDGDGSDAGDDGDGCAVVTSRGTASKGGAAAFLASMLALVWRRRSERDVDLDRRRGDAKGGGARRR